MPTRVTESQSNGLGGAAKHVAEHASALVRLELELASLELKRKLGALGLGIGLGIGAALVAVFALGFLFATLAAGLATFMATWLALLLVSLLLLVIAGVLAFLGVRAMKRGTPPVPQEAIREAKLTTSALKGNGSA